MKRTKSQMHEFEKDYDETTIIPMDFADCIAVIARQAETLVRIHHAYSAYASRASLDSGGPGLPVKIYACAYPLSKIALRLFKRT